MEKHNKIKARLRENKEEQEVQREEREDIQGENTNTMHKCVMKMS